MAKIFISYRREDSKHAVGRLHAALARHVANPRQDIFIDIDNIPKGVDFVDHLDSQIAKCDVMLAVIGPSWLSITEPNSSTRRLDDPGDFVRVEVASALRRGIPVVPVVLDDTRMPSAADLPEDLRPLTRRNGERLKHESFDADVDRLIRGLPAMNLGRSGSGAPPGGGANAALAAALAVLVVGGAGAWAWFANPGDWRGTPTATPPANAAVTPDPPATSPAPAAQAPPAGVNQEAGACGDVDAIVYFGFDKSTLSPEAKGVLENALRKTFDCVVDEVAIEAHEDLGSSAAYAQKLSERRADDIAAFLSSNGIPDNKITRTGLGNARPLQDGVSQPENRRASVILRLSDPPR